MKWISVEEELPPKETEVLVLYCKEICIADFCSADFWIDDETIEIENCTHWMPLPKPPEEQ